MSTLSSGRQVIIRPIRPDDGERLQAAYLRLSERSRYQRFLAPKPRLTDPDIAYLVDVDGRTHVALVATTTERPDQIIAVARFVREPADERSAEFAIAVGDPFQGEGLGAMLLERLAAEAAARGIERLTAVTLADNLAVHRLVHRIAGAEVRVRHRGVVDELEVPLAAVA